MKINKHKIGSLIKNKLIFVILLLSWLLTGVGKANNSIDSLAHLLHNATETDKIEILNQLAKKTNPNAPADGYKYAIEALHLANKHNDKQGKADAYNMMAYSWLYRGQCDSALLYYHKCDAFCKELDDPERTGNLFFSFGQVYYFKGDSKLGLEYYMKAMNVFESNNNIEGLAKTIYSIGYMHYDNGRYDSAMYYFKKGIDLSENEPDCLSITTSLYNGSGNVFYDWGKYDKAIEYYNKALIINKKIDNKPGVAYGINNMGNVYYDWRKYDSAFMNYEYAHALFLEIGNVKGQAIALHNMGLICDATARHEEAFSYYEKALSIYSEIGQPTGMAETLNEMGESSKKAGDFKKAIQFANKSQEYALQHNLSEVIFDNYHILSVAYANTGRPALALEYYKKYTAVKDSLFNEKMHQQISELETRYESEQKDKQITLLSSENQLKEMRIRNNQILMFSLVGFVVLLILFGMVFIRQNKLKVEQQNLLLKQQLFRSQMNPHFIFNSLASIQNSIINEESIKASKYLARFSKLVRNILDSSVQEFIPLEEEINTVENYLALQKIRFPEKFDYSIEVDDAIDPQTIQIPPMLAQPFIENAIEHGIKHKNAKGTIQVRFTWQNGILILEVEDDGIGRQKALEILLQQNNGHKSLATSITSDRIQVLNRKKSRKISMEIIDLKDDQNVASGTKVRFEIPVLK
jgi:tetratricopeptide (TPR) repeat protein